jgi:hypothetical protein
MNSSSTNTYQSILYKDCNQKPLATDIIITRCATNDCKDCTGSYYNEMLQHRFICKCPCHDNSYDEKEELEKEVCESTHDQLVAREASQFSAAAVDKVEVAG